MPSNSGETIAQAYVQILPSTEGIQGQLTELLGGETDEAGRKAGGSLAKTLVKGFIAVGAVKAIGDTIKGAFDNYANFEQLSGGVETLFKDSADTVMQYAENAYQTAGLSANQYMETVTSFSASLLQSLDGDTEAAAKAADMAITDMADNANKMGTSMESIQNAYQGFAKQNYTMLDNLKLGYGGTKEEMERLLADASKLSGVEYDISSYADIVEAIHVVQTEMGITGTTAREASETISGSVAATKAAWQNLLTGIADENADMDQLIDNFINSAVTAGENILPRIGQIMTGLGQLISAGAEKLIPIAVQVLTDNLPTLVSAGVTLTISLVTGILSATPELIAAIPDILMAIFNGLRDGWPALKAAGTELLSMVINGIVGAYNDLKQAAQNAIQHVKDGFNARIQEAKNWGRDLVQNFINGLIEKWQALKDQVKAMAQTVKDFLGFSEPKEGPLSNFSTYAPDMVDLWNQGLRDNESKIRQQLSTTFAIGDQMRAMTPVPQYVQAAEGAAARAQTGPRQLVVVLELNRSELGRVVYDLNNEETQRVGVRLAGGVA